MTFPPIAVVGQACVLPGAFSPEELWAGVLAGRDFVGPAPDGYWGVDPARVMVSPDHWSPDKIWSDRGGYVRDFGPAFNPSGFEVSAGDVLAMDEQFHWVLHVARQALGQVSVGDRGRAGLVLGNLAYPTFALSRYAESVWLEGAGRPADARPHPLNRFHAGAIASFTAKALGLGAGAFALDAACASSLYAIKLACDRLHDRRADVMLTGAVNRCDDLLIHAGFCSLGALSKSGRSRPFHAAADGLVPSEGAVLVALKRLDDAEAAGDTIFGVIRGIGLSNDGRQGGLLSPSAAGQARAMRAAYRASGIDPRTVSLVECHATGTPVGDAVEANSLCDVFAGAVDLPIGSLKSNLGHLITAAGAAGLLKVLAAFQAGVRPPTLHADTLRRELSQRPLRILHEPEEWGTDGPRRAAVSAFGFGGANSHMVVEEWRPAAKAVTVGVTPAATGPVAVVGLVVHAGGLDTDGFAERLFAGGRWQPAARRMDEVVLDAKQVSFPPRDLGRTLAQQLVVLDAALKATRGVRLAGETTAVYVGMQCDAEAPRCVARIRLPESPGDSPDRIAAARDAIAARLEAAAVIGAMPNIPANRINSQLDLGGPGFTVAADELSGVRALEIATRALRAGEIDAAVVGAVDLCCEPVHTLAAASVLPPSRGEPGDAAVVLVLKRLEDAGRDGDTVLALLDEVRPTIEPAIRLTLDDDSSFLSTRFGHPHAASGLLLTAAGILAVSRRLRPAAADAGPCPWVIGPRRVDVAVTALGGQSATIHLSEHRQAPADFTGCPFAEVPQVHLYAGADRKAVLRALDRDEPSGDGPARLVLIASDAESLSDLKAKARAALLAGDRVDIGPLAVYRDRPLGGKVAFVGGSAATTYQGMGASLLWAFPELMETVSGCVGTDVPEASRWWDAATADRPVAVFDKLAGGMALTTAHGVFTREVLGLRPDAALGLSSGEKDVLFAAGLCDRAALGSHLQAVRDTGLLTAELAGTYTAARRAWRLVDGEPVAWSMWRVMATAERVREALHGETRVHLGILHAPGDVLIVGDRAGCVRILARLGKPTALEVTDYSLVFHAPEMLESETAMRRSHHLPITPQSGVRYYTSTETDQPLTPDSFLTTYIAQAAGTADFPRPVIRAWEEGVRIFVEHGPHNLCTRWIGQILGDREHLAVSLDARGSDPLVHIARTIAELVAAGVKVDLGAFNARLGQLRAGRSRPATPPSHPLRFPAHLPPVVLPAESLHPVSPVSRSEAAVTRRMDRAPVLPCVFDDAPAPVAVAESLPADASANLAPPPVNSASISPAVVLQQTEADEPALAEPHEDYSTVLDAVRTQGRVFRNYLENQHRVHRKFLDVRDSVLSSFGWSDMQAEGGEVVPEVVPAVLDFIPLAPPPSDPQPAVASAFETEAVRPTLNATPRSQSFGVTPPAAPVMPARHTGSTKPPCGPSFDRDQLIVLAIGQISTVFGPMFEQQDDYPRQVRLPAPPLLLVDRITGIDAPPGVHGRGTIWTETDVTWDSWYLHRGVMPAGIMIEAGQADLTLISWMGADFQNRGERVYRLLGCDLTYHGGLPRPGDTLRYDIHIDGHARQGDIRLFFFHYDGHIGDDRRISVRNGQAGFFTDQELNDSGGILWAPETGEHSTTARLDPPRVASARPTFSRDQLTAYYDGRLADCFGAGYELLHTHTLSPCGGKTALRLLDEITHCDARGGPWGRGYLRARTAISPTDWFFEGHFHNDPCMPGTLMFEGTLQAMAFYLTWLGYTLDRDGWRFEPVPEETYKLRCRGQTVPSSRELVCELFIEEVHDGPEPMIYADLLGTVDGLKAFHCRRMGLRLVPDWPLSARPPEPALSAAARPFAASDDVRGDFPALLACAWGQPTHAFGSMYSVFDDGGAPPRLPGPPYHFMSRVTRIDAEKMRPRAGATVEVEYDVPPDAWYFARPGTDGMPFSVLLEANLQPCGWLASFLGFAVKASQRLYFRNLNGTGTVHREVGADAGTLRVRSTLTDFSEFGGLVIVSFKTAATANDLPVCEFETSFGFFTAASLAKQTGLVPSPAEIAALDEVSEFVADLTTHPARYFAGPLALRNDSLRMIDRVTGYWPTGGKAGLGRVRSEQTVDPAAWYFKAHFYQDPVQPGSLGMEAMLQVLQFFMVEKGLHEGIPNPVFEPIAPGRPFGWKYRGQVVPTNGRVRIEMDAVDIGRDDHGPYVVADLWLWVDGLRIYQAQGLAMRVRPGSE